MIARFYFWGYVFIIIASTVTNFRKDGEVRECGVDLP
jgi:hypothetical protein